MLNLLRQSLLKLSEFGVKKFAEPIPNVLQKSDGRFRQLNYAARFNKKALLKKAVTVIHVGTYLVMGSVTFIMSYAYVQVKIDEEKERAIYKKNQLKNDNIDNKKQS